MGRYLGVFLGAAVSIAAIRLLVSWLAHRPTASPTHVLCITNTAVMFAILEIITGVVRRGLTVYQVFDAAVMMWIAYAAARAGAVGSMVAQGMQTRRATAAAAATPVAQRRREQLLMDRADRLHEELESLRYDPDPTLSTVQQQERIRELLATTERLDSEIDRLNNQ